MRNVSESTVKRLSKYLRTLSYLEENGIRTISSEKMAQIEGISSAQVRKDLSFFGSFGKRGLGYNVSMLKKKVEDILGLNRPWNIALIGVGNLGTALIDYNEFRKKDFHIILAFDNDPKKIGKKVKGVEVIDIKNLREEVIKHNISIAIITVPAEAAQKIVDLLDQTGVKAILNFTPRTLNPPDSITIRNEDTSTELEALTYYITNQ